MFKAAVITVSDRSFRGERPDTSGPLVVELLQTAGYDVCFGQSIQLSEGFAGCIPLLSCPFKGLLLRCLVPTTRK